jgi:hypothetical protein
VVRDEEEGRKGRWRRHSRRRWAEEKRLFWAIQPALVIKWRRPNEVQQHSSPTLLFGPPGALAIFLRSIAPARVETATPCPCLPNPSCRRPTALPSAWSPNRANTDQTVPKNPRVGIIAYSPGYKAIWHAPPSTSSLTQVPSSRFQIGQETNRE